MAQQLGIQGGFGYRSVQLIKSEANCLGIGSYGAVYKAKCDQLPCAAKILHPILFATRDPAARRIVQRFEQECDFLSRIRHTNIIQFLGTSRDPESRLPVLLMELMDESLTSFLERPQDPPPLPFHIQVNIAHDVAQALAYLHLNEILHRDLSSNNVLLVGSSRAKVTDFGMSKLLGNDPRLTPTFCPGTMVYMSPEALGEPPAYTRKLDIFSSGVLHVQIITRKFPDPGPRMKAIQMGSDSPFGETTVHLNVSEVERRKAHVDLIDPAHPLLRIALDCLKDKEGQRPTAEQLCSRLAALKESPRYRDSLQPAQQAAENLGVAAEAQAEPQRELLQQSQELRQQLEEGREALQAKEREVDDVTRNMEQLQLQSHTQERQAQDREAEIRRKNEHIHQIGEQLRQTSEQLQERNVQTQRKEAQIQQLRQTSQDSEQLIATLQQSIEQKDEALRTQAEALGAKEQALQEKERQLQQSQRVGGGKPRGPAPEPVKLRWKNGPKAPLKTFGETVAVLGRVAYFYSWNENKIMMYDSETGKWAILPECPKAAFSIAVVNGLLTAIGGRQSGNDTKSLLSLTRQQKWTEQFPPMTYYHNDPVVACTSTSLIVAGGYGSDEERAPVEVMDTETLRWSTAASLPYPWHQATATICGDSLYIAGGFANDVMTKSVLTCVVSELLQSTATQHPSSEATPTASGLQPSTDGQRVWQELAELPVYWSALVTLQGRLLAVGGCDSDCNPISAVHQYNSATNSWNVVSRMNNKRIYCFAAVLPDNTLVVVGGTTGIGAGTSTDIVEIASCM